MEKLKILLGPSQMGQPAIDKLESKGFDVIANPYQRKLTKDELKILLVGVDGIIAGLEPLDREIIENSSLKVISRCGSGIMNVDTEAAKDAGVHFYYTPLGPTASVAEMTLCNILTLLRNIPEVNNKMHERKWEKNTGNLLSGKNVLIIGFGKIGRAVADLLKPFKVKIVVVDPYFVESDYTGSVTISSLDEALPIADIVLIHTSSTDTILNEEKFKLIKSGAFILNAARGTSIDEMALINVLKRKKISGAWLDVFSEEPYFGPLCDCNNVILTPHISSYTVEGRLNMENEAVENLIEGFKESGLI